MASLNDNNENIRKALLFLNEGDPLYDFIRYSEIEEVAFENFFTTVHRFTFTAPPQIFKKTVALHGDFIITIKNILHANFNFSDVLVAITADWSKLSNLNAEIKPVSTDWDKINEMQETLMEQIQLASATISFQNVGNTSRHILQKLSDTVFDAGKHTTVGNSRDLGPASYKNRLWAFVLYKFSDSAANAEITNYAISLLESSDRAIDLSNKTTHTPNANNFLAQSCAISAITTVHLIKLAFDKPDPK